MALGALLKLGLRRAPLCFLQFVNFPRLGIHKFFHRATVDLELRFGRTTTKKEAHSGLLFSGKSCGLRYLAGGFVVVAGFGVVAGLVAAGFGAAVGVGAAGGGAATPEAVL